MRPHDDQIGVHFHGDVVDVVEQVADPNCRFGRSVKRLQQVLGKSLEPFSSFAKFVLFRHNVHEVEFAVQGLANGNGVVDSIGGDRGEIHGHQDAVLRHASKIERIVGMAHQRGRARNLAVLLNLKSLK